MYNENDFLKKKKKRKKKYAVRENLNVAFIQTSRREVSFHKTFGRSVISGVKRLIFYKIR